MYFFLFCTSHRKYILKYSILKVTNGKERGRETCVVDAAALCYRRDDSKSIMRKKSIKKIETITVTCSHTRIHIEACRVDCRLWSTTTTQKVHFTIYFNQKLSQCWKWFKLTGGKIDINFPVPHTNQRATMLNISLFDTH